VGGNWLAFTRDIGPLDSLWSLAVEDQFYVTWAPALAMMLTAGWSISRITELTAVVCLTLLAWQIVIAIGPRG
jgi:peptidoglycan/LPS O-acetylase OafA/YrhL